MQIILTNQIIQCVRGKHIKDFTYENFYKGERPLDDTIKLDNLHKVTGTYIIQTDSNTLFLDNGYVITFGYDNGGIRYFSDILQAKVMKKNQKLITGGFMFNFTFEDDSCLVISNNSWTGSFKMLMQSEYRPSEKLNPFDSEKSTQEVFQPHFQKNIAVIAVCSTTKGFMDVQRGIIHEALFQSKIRPKTKASKLTDEEINCLYHTIKNITHNIKSSGGLNGEIDLFGQKGSYEFTISKNAVGKPCPVCGVNIEKENAFGSSIFICPN